MLHKQTCTNAMIACHAVQVSIGDDCLIAWWTWLSNPAAVKLLYPVQEFCLNVYWFVALLSWLIVAVHWMLFIRLLEAELDTLLIIPKVFLKNRMLNFHCLFWCCSCCLPNTMLVVCSNVWFCLDVDWTCLKFEPWAMMLKSCYFSSRKSCFYCCMNIGCCFCSCCMIHFEAMLLCVCCLDLLGWLMNTRCHANTLLTVFQTLKPAKISHEQMVLVCCYVMVVWRMFIRCYAVVSLWFEFVWMLLLMLYVTFHKPCCRNPRASSHIVLLAVVVLCCMNVLYVTMLVCTILLKFIGHDVWLKLSIWIALLLYYAKP